MILNCTIFSVFGMLLSMKNLKRLNKALSEGGISSRRGADDLILAGDVSVNGEVVKELGTKIDPAKDVVHVGKKKVYLGRIKKVFILNKPKGFVCSNRRINKQRLVIDLFPKEELPLFTVGRLDKDTTGLLLLTNDGDFAQKVIHPSNNITKEYVVKVEEPIEPSHLKRISKGAYIDGRMIRPHKITKLNKKTVSIVVKEGKKHEVRKFVANGGLTLTSLRRTRIGNLTLKKVQEGHYELLTEKELVF